MQIFGSSSSLSRSLTTILLIIMLTGCSETTYKADTYTAKTLTGILREYVELPKCTAEVLNKCHTLEVAKLASEAAKQWTASNTAYKKAIETKSGTAAAKAANDVSLAALKAIAESETVTKALAQ